MKLLQGIFCVLLVASLAYAAEKVIIDDFTSSQSLQIAIQPPFPNIIASSTTGTMTGGERDMRLFGFSGTTGIFVSSQVLGGNWFLACQRGANCQSSLTFDGRDNSPNIAFSGLGSFDFTNNGANALTLTVETDINTFYNLTFYETGTNGARSASARFPTLTGPPQEYIVPFSSFTTVTGMDFTRVGSFVLFAEGGVDVDSTAQLFATFANDISGNVWRDCDRSGTKDNGELNFSGVPVTVFDAVNNDIVETVITDASGNFVASVVPGSYRVCASPSVGSPTVPANNCTTVSVVIAQDVTGINFGFTIPVTVTPPPTRNVNCSSSTLPASTGTATGTGCSAPTITFSDSNSTSCIGEVTITRTWTATLGPDSASGIQIITTFDDNAPIFSNFPANRNLQCGADTSPDAQGRPTATDNCSFGNIGFVDIAPTGGNGCSAPFQRQWTATDACGNFVNRNQSISITDNGAPFFDFFPDNVTVDCSQGTTPATTGSPSADDACTEIASLTFVDTNSTSGCNRVITRAWTARDSCGNVVTRNQQIRTQDTQAPTFFQFPNDVNVNCGTSTAPQFTGGAANATDDCGTATVSFRDTAPSTGCSAPIARNWTVIDNCGNAFSRIQNIFVVDETIPNFTNFPATFTGTCSQSRDPSVTGRPGATDSCTSVAPEDITFSDAVSNDDCTVTIVRTWTIEDTCGNINTRDQSLTYTDRQNPTFVTFPNSVSVNCNEGTTPSTTGTPTVDDDCTDVPSLSFADSINGDGCTGGISRTWTVEDDCGNFVTRVQTITITDTVRPEFVNFPEDRSIQCTDDKSTGSNGFPSASDNCDSDPDLTFTDRETGALCPNGITLTRTFRVTDLCGNFNTRDQTIEIDLDQDPIIDIPDDTTIDCDDSILPSNTGGSATATSPCDPNVRILPYVDTVVTDSCPRTISRLWTAEDTCGNDVSGTQTITQTDLERPVLTIPADVTISCADDIDDLAKTGRASATDNCDSSVTPTYTDSAPTTLPVVGTCPADNVVERTWTAVDDCGNVASDVQTITISGTSIGSCRPVPCRPVACDDSSCPEDCPGTPNCLASPCQAQACTRGNCAAERCSTCPVVCKPKACDEIQYIYVDDEDDIPGN